MNQIDELPGARAGNYDVNGVTLHTVAAGSGSLLLLLHGITANAYVFLPLMAALQDRYSTVSMEIRGHGRSSKPESGYSAQDLSDDVAALIRRLGRGPSILVGHALGARDALVTGARFPDLVSAVVAVEFLPFIESSVFEALEQRIGSGQRRYENKDEIRTALTHRYPLMPKDAIERRTKYGYVERDGAWEPLASPQATTQIVRGMREDITPAVRKVRAPTLLVRGAVSRFITDDAWRRTKELRSDFDTAVIPDADHYLSEGAPRELASTIALFLSRRETQQGQVPTSPGERGCAQLG